MGTPAYNPQALLQTALVDTGTGLILRNQFPFFTAVQNLLKSSYLPVFAAAQYGADPTGKNDSAPGIIAAYNAAIAAGGGTIFFGPGIYTLLTPVNLTPNTLEIGSTTVPTPISFVGAGGATVFVRGANMPTGQGCFDIQAATDLTFSSFVFDGAVITPVGVTYSQIPNYDPLAPILSNNTSFWIHDGSANISFIDVVYQHAAGYSIIAQAVSAGISGLYFYRLQLLNNRPTLFGLASSDTTYGSWNGGVICHADGIAGTAGMTDIHFLSCSAERCDGTAYWVGHIYAFGPVFDQVSFEDMHFLDDARDGIQLGACTGCRITDVSAHRMGYTTQTDSDTSVPKWQSGQWSVTLDCGVSFGTVITGVNLTSICGGGVDLDGMISTTLCGFTMRNPVPGDPDYGPDQIGAVGFAGAATPGGVNASYGINSSPSGYGPYAEGGHKISSGIIENFSAGAIRLYGTVNNAISDIRILHPSPNNGAPIQVGNLSATERSIHNSITNCHFEYFPATAAPCIDEAGGLASYLSSDVNFFLGNQVVQPSNATEYTKDPNSGSIGGVTGAVPATGTLTFTSGFLTAT